MTVTFAESGISAQWTGEHENILDLAFASGLRPMYRCGHGSCHACATVINKGRVTYNPEPAFEPEGGEVLICCAIPVADIILEL